MNESDARQVMLVRALETPPGVDQWQEEDRDWASRSTVKALGSQADGETFIVRRAALALERLGGRGNESQRLLAGVTWRGWITPLVVAVAFLVGLLADAVSANRQINILAPPLLALLVWNLAVYLAIAASWLGGASRHASGGQRLPGRAAGPLTRLLVRLAGASRLLTGQVTQPARPAAAHPTAPTAPVPEAGAAGRSSASSSASSSAATTSASSTRSSPSSSPSSSTSSPTSAASATARATQAAQRFIGDWVSASAPLTTARAHACLHFAAASFAAGALLGLYARGLAFEYLAGWDSTFLDAAQVHGLLQLVLGPASFLTGMALPDVAELARLKFSASAGENAARWIHLHAVTIGLVVIVPRVLLGAAAQFRARRIAADFPLSLDDAYFRHLDRRHRGALSLVQIVPYSYTLGEVGRQAIERLMHRTYGENTRVELASPLPMGEEEELARHWQFDPTAALVVALFGATATPEHENHGALLDELHRLVGGEAPLMVMVDETGFRQRFGADLQRIASREAAWRKLVEHHRDAEPWFVSLDQQTGDEAADNLEQWLAEQAGRLGQNDGMLSRDATAPAGSSV